MWSGSVLEAWLSRTRAATDAAPAIRHSEMLTPNQKLLNVIQRLFPVRALPELDATSHPSITSINPSKAEDTIPVILTDSSLSRSEWPRTTFIANTATVARTASAPEMGRTIGGSNILEFVSTRPDVESAKCGQTLQSNGDLGRLVYRLNFPSKQTDTSGVSVSSRTAHRSTVV
jgi:hypothetical protein